VSGVLLFGEKLDRWQIALIGITLPCTLIFSIDGEGFALHPLGLIGILTASLTWVAINIIIKKSGALMNGPGLIIIRTPFLCLTFVAGYTIFLWLGSVPALTLDISAFDLLIITGAALCLPILPYALFPLVLKYTDLSTMAVLGAIQPLVAFFAGLVLFGETTDAIRMTAALIGIGAGILYAVHIVIKNPKINRPD
jgi:drug/metabolite transporter (DMT)-like permease